MALNNEYSYQIVEILDKIKEADSDDKRMLIEELSRLYRLEAMSQN